jgi:hypothetical protein
MKRIIIGSVIALSLVVAAPAQAASLDGLNSMISSLESLIGSLKSLVTSGDQPAAVITTTTLKRVQTNDNLNVRDRASAKAKLMGTAPTGTLGTVLETASNREGSWSKVGFYNGVTGWVLTQYLNVYTGALPQPSLSGYTDTASTAVLFWNTLPVVSGVAGSKLYRSVSPATPVLYSTSGANGFYIDTGLAPNTVYTYQVSVFDTAGVESEKSGPVTISTIDNTPPTILIVSPSWSNVATGNSVYLSTHVNDNWGIGNIKGMQYYLSQSRTNAGSKIGPYMTVAPFNLGGAGNPNNYPGWDSTTVPNGEYFLHAVTSDLAGNYATATPVYFQVRN